MAQPERLQRRVLQRVQHAAQEAAQCWPARHHIVECLAHRCYLMAPTSRK